MKKDAYLVLVFLCVFACGHKDTLVDIPSTDEKTAVRSITQKGSVLCDALVCDTLNSYYVVYQYALDSWVKQIYPNRPIVITEKRGILTLGYWGCQECVGTTYIEVKDSEEKLLFRKKCITVE